MKCNDCDKDDDTVVEVFCPFAEDVHGKQIEVILCPNCYHERCMDI